MASNYASKGDRGRSKDKHRQIVTTTTAKDVKPAAEKQGNTGEWEPLDFRKILRDAKRAEAKA